MGFLLLKIGLRELWLPKSEFISVVFKTKRINTEGKNNFTKVRHLVLAVTHSGLDLLSHGGDNL